MFSSSTVRCSSPRPETIKESASSVSSTFNATLISSSFCNRSRSWRLVTNLPSVPASGEVFTPEVHVQRRLIHQQQRQRLRIFLVADGDADAHFFNPGNQDDIPGLRFFQLHPFQTVESHHLVDLGIFRGTIRPVHHDYLLTRLDTPVGNATNADATDETGIVQCGNL